MLTPEDVEFKIFPRMLALSETAWSKAVKIEFEMFVVKVNVFKKFFEKNKINYCAISLK